MGLCVEREEGAWFDSPTIIPTIIINAELRQSPASGGTAPYSAIAYDIDAAIFAISRDVCAILRSPSIILRIEVIEEPLTVSSASA